MFYLTIELIKIILFVLGALLAFPFLLVGALLSEEFALRCAFWGVTMIQRMEKFERDLEKYNEK